MRALRIGCVRNTGESVAGTNNAHKGGGGGGGASHRCTKIGHHSHLFIRGIVREIPHKHRRGVHLALIFECLMSRKGGWVPPKVRRRKYNHRFIEALTRGDFI